MLLHTPSDSFPPNDFPSLTEEYKTFFELSPDLYCAIALDGYAKNLNPACSGTLGQSNLELETKPWWEWMHPEDISASQQAVQQCRRGKRIELVTRCQHGAGYYRWLSWQLFGTPEGQILIFGQDISQQKQTEAELDRIFNLPLDLICIAGYDGYFKRINTSWLHTLGYTESDLLEHPFLDFVHPDDRDATLGATAQLAEGKQLIDFENRYLCKDGSYKWLAWRATPLPEEKLLYSVARDITTIKAAIAKREAAEAALQQAKAQLEQRVIERTQTLQQTIEQLQNEMADRRRAEALLEMREQSLRAILDRAPIWIWQTDVNGKMQFVNRTFCESVGVPESSFLAVSHYKEILGEAESAKCIASDRACWESDAPNNTEEIIPFVDGKLHHLEIIKAKIKDASNRPIGLIGLALDATERKQQAQLLQRSEAKYRELAQRESLLNRLTRAIRNSLDLDTILQTAVEEIRSLLQISSCIFIWYHPSDRQEEAYWEVVTESRDSKSNTLLGRYSAQEIGSITQLLISKQIIRVDDVQALSDRTMGNFFTRLGLSSVLALPIETHSGSIGVVCCNHAQEIRPWDDCEVELLQTVRDTLAIAINQAGLYLQTLEASRQAQAQTQQLAQTLHELKQTQTQLIQSEKMSSLGQLVAGVAHEINNPVNFIYGNLSHASEYIDDLISLVEIYQKHESPSIPEIQDCKDEIDLDFVLEDLPKLFESMRVGTTRIREIVLSLRNFSRLDEAEMKVVDLHQGIESTLMILQHRLKAKAGRTQIEVIKEYGDLPEVECYPGQLNQVFMNIVANAIDALEECYLRLSSENKDTSEYVPTIWIKTEMSNARRVSISIRDNGQGIPPELQQHLFDPFFTTKSIGAGTGLGLSISYQIVVEKHGGQLQCISELGKGAEFKIQIPFHPR